jgi:hypothetical protein
MIFFAQVPLFLSVEISVTPQFTRHFPSNLLPERSQPGQISWLKTLKIGSPLPPPPLGTGAPTFELGLGAGVVGGVIIPVFVVPV